MGSFYYLMAQLPFLVIDQKPPMSSKAFHDLAESILDKEDASLLDHVTINVITDSDNTPTGCVFIDNWREWERTVRLNLAKNRALKLKREAPLTEPPAFPSDAASAAAKAVNDLYNTAGASPLTVELALDNARWNAIDAFAGIDYFSREAVYAYLLKLMLIERRQLFETEKGFTEYKSLYSAIIGNINNSIIETA